MEKLYSGINEREVHSAEGWVLLERRGAELHDAPRYFMFFEFFSAYLSACTSCMERNRAVRVVPQHKGYGKSCCLPNTSRLQPPLFLNFITVPKGAVH